MGGAIVEDAWLRKEDDFAHIQCRRIIDAVLKGINLAIKWNLQIVEIMTDSATVCGWTKSAITDDHKI